MRKQLKSENQLYKIVKGRYPRITPLGLERIGPLGVCPFIVIGDKQKRIGSLSAIEN